MSDGQRPRVMNSGMLRVKGNTKLNFSLFSQSFFFLVAKLPCMQFTIVGMSVGRSAVSLDIFRTVMFN